MATDPYDYPGDLLAQHLIDHHGREGIAFKLAAAIETIRQLKRTT